MRPMATLGNLTIVVPTRNEAANIEGFLRSLPTEVALVVVDKSEDSTREIIDRVRPLNTLVIACEGTLTEARQLGAARAATRWMLFTDADVEFAEDYFDRLDDALDRLGAAAQWPEPLVPGQGLGIVYGPKLSTSDYR